MRGLKTSLLRAILALGILSVGSLEARAVEIDIPMSTPRLEGLSAEIPASEGTAVLSAVLRYDAKGKVVGEASIDGQPASVKGSLKKAKDGWTYSVTFKGLSEPVSCRVSGAVGSGVAMVKYSGPKGKASLVGLPVTLEATQGSSSGALSGSLQIDSKGKITGTARFASGLGNDPEGDGKVSGKATLTTVSLKFKSGKQTITFKGEVQGQYIVGTLKIKSPPAKETVRSFSIPLNGSFNPPPGDDHESETEQTLFTIQLDGTTGFMGSVTVNRVTTASGRVFNRAYVEISSGRFYYRNLEGIVIDPSLPIPPTALGRWLSFPLEVYDAGDPGHQFKTSGTLTIDVTQAGETGHAGTWKLSDNAFGLSISGTWNGTTGFESR